MPLRICEIGALKSWVVPTTPTLPVTVIPSSLAIAGRVWLPMFCSVGVACV